MSPRRAGILCLLALAYTGLNALIPLQVDDAAYACYGRQISRHPLDPYGFAIQWYDVPQPANDVLAPPVLPYSVAPAVALFGERPALWKLTLLPWALLLALTLHAHLHRFAPGLELRLTAFVLFSPALLPSLNLMLDVPSLALSLAAVYVFLRACDTGSVGRALVAGVTAALAMQTKYTGVLALAVALVAAVIYRRPGLVAVMAVMAAVGFVAWEVIVARAYGQSHFLSSLESDATKLSSKFNLIPVFFSQLGGLAPAVILLGLVAIGVSGPRIFAAGVAILAGYAAITLFDFSYAGSVRPSPRFFEPVEPFRWTFQLAEILSSVLAAAGVIVFVYAVRKLRDEATDRDGADTRFLLAWLWVEIVGYLVLTPFPAARRVLGVFVIVTILFGRLASRTCTVPGRQRSFDGIVAVGIVLGLAYLGIDWLGARAYQRGAEEAAEFVASNGGGRVWYTGRWAFRYYAERLGMDQVVPRYEAGASYVELPPPSRLRRGDWLVVAEDKFALPRLNLAAVPREEVSRIAIDDPVPLRVVPCFFGGRTPLEHREGARLTVVIYRIDGDCEVELLDR